jgi:hypothetical protein
VQDVLQVCGALSAEQNAQAKMVLDRIVAMLTKLGQRGYAIHEEPGEYRAGRIDSDTDTDPDSEGNMKPENRQDHYSQRRMAHSVPLSRFTPSARRGRVPSLGAESSCMPHGFPYAWAL